MVQPEGQLRELALFAGCGGGLLATQWLLGWRCVAACEIEPYRRERLLQRQYEGYLHRFPIWDDIRTLDGGKLRGHVDVVTAGFPCPAFSVAGKQLAGDDPRNLWPDTIRVIREARPRYALLENVPGLVSCGYFGTVLGDLADCGFDARWRVLSAAEVGAPHLRKRVWILAHPRSVRMDIKHRRVARKDRQGTVFANWDGSLQQMADAKQDGWNKASPRRIHRSLESPTISSCKARTRQAIPIDNSGENVADAEFPRLEEQQCEPRDDATERTTAERNDHAGEWWSVEPDVGRVVDGLAFRVDRLRALGDGQVPAVAATAWRLLTKDL